MQESKQMSRKYLQDAIKHNMFTQGFINKLVCLCVI